MNRINAYLDEVFGKFYESNALNDLKEEIRMNAQDRFNECMDEGKSEAEAEETVLSAMGDLEGMLEENGAVRIGSTSQNFEGSMKGFAESMQGLSEMFSKMFHAQEGEDGHLEEAYANIEQIVIRGTSMDITVTPSDNDQVLMKADGDVERLQIIAGEDGTLTVQEKGSASVFTNGVDLSLQVPVLKALSVNTVSGDVSIRECDVKALDFHTVSGDGRMSLKDPEQLEYTATSGDLILNAGEINSLKIKTVSGDVKLKALGIHDGTMNTTSGDVIVQTRNPLHVQTSTVSGDIAGMRRSDPSSADHLSVHTVSGDIVIR